MTRLLLVRHGQSMANLDDIFAGHLDVELSPLGHEQAERTAEFIAENYKVDKVYASDLKRAYKTAEHIAAKFGLEVIPVKQMREISAGEWDGETFDALWEKYPEEVGMWKNDIGNAGCTGGETTKDNACRIAAALEKIAQENEGKTVVVATHATPIRVTQCAWQGISFDGMKDIDWVSNASVTEGVYENGVFKMVKSGQDAHLAELKTELPANV